ncbi:hypothetical protein LZ480_16600 [Solibacillus sp. MA9]|uniref:YozE SAM-like domain-containing protein n=1 Tax=Solibacillus palustris TaxID=2908203 RepID=A0ABS9UGL8_9BACL|nr:hypothetical protein [Solibacillus sp. MA9]MCH7323497.1 hypothetical protein [Solibacillus sp. MA9]
MTFYIKCTNEFNKQLIQAIDNAFLGSNYPYKLKDAIRNLFMRDAVVYKKIVDSFEEEDLEIPELLKID